MKEEENEKKGSVTASVTWSNNKDDFILIVRDTSLSGGFLLSKVVLPMKREPETALHKAVYFLHCAEDQGGLEAIKRVLRPEIALQLNDLLVEEGRVSSQNEKFWEVANALFPWVFENLE